MIDFTELAGSIAKDIKCFGIGKVWASLGGLPSYAKASEGYLTPLQLRLPALKLREVSGGCEVTLLVWASFAST